MLVIYCCVTDYPHNLAAERTHIYYPRISKGQEIGHGLAEAYSPWSLTDSI